MECYVGDSTGDAATALLVYQSTAVFSGWGSGNCWFDKLDAKAFFVCKNMGAMTANSVNRLSFQFAIGNVGKAWTAGAVVPKFTAMSCKVEVYTTSTAEMWYT